MSLCYNCTAPLYFRHQGKRLFSNYWNGLFCAYLMIYMKMLRIIAAIGIRVIFQNLILYTVSYLPCFRRYLALARDRRFLFPRRVRSFSLSSSFAGLHDERLYVYTAYFSTFFPPVSLIRFVPQSFAHEI